MDRHDGAIRPGSVCSDIEHAYACGTLSERLEGQDVTVRCICDNPPFCSGDLGRGHTDVNEPLPPPATARGLDGADGWLIGPTAEDAQLERAPEWCEVVFGLFQGFPRADSPELWDVHGVEDEGACLVFDQALCPYGHPTPVPRIVTANPAPACTGPRSGAGVGQLFCQY